jgi:hypothetical protein
MSVHGFHPNRTTFGDGNQIEFSYSRGKPCDSNLPLPLSATPSRAESVSQRPSAPQIVVLTGGSVNLVTSALAMRWTLVMHITGVYRKSHLVEGRRAKAVHGYL